MRVKPTNNIIPRPMALLADDSLTINQGDGNLVHLVKEPFTPAATTATVSLTMADFTGSAALTSTITPNASRDPLSGDQVVTIPPPAGGWYWEATADTLLPQTIYGVAVSGSDSGFTWGSFLLDDPIEISEIGDSVALDSVQFRLAAGALG